MIFWILVGIVSLLAIIMFFVAWLEDCGFLGGLFWGALTFAGSALVGWLLFGFIEWTARDAPYTNIKESTEVVQLQAVSANDTLSGKFYLRGGSFGGERSLNFTAQNNGYSTLEKVSADKSKIFEDGKKEVHVITSEKSRWWLSPHVKKDVRYEFHIPESSIVENFEIK